MRLPVLAYRHPERSRGIFPAGWKTVYVRRLVIPSHMKHGVSRSPLPSHLLLSRERKRFLASLEMTIRGKAVLSFSACLRHFPHSLSYRQCPIRPFGAPSPRGEGFWYGAAVFSFRHPRSHEARCFPFSAILTSFAFSRTKKIPPLRSK